MLVYLYVALASIGVGMLIGWYLKGRIELLNGCYRCYNCKYLEKMDNGQNRPLRCRKFDRYGSIDVPKVCNLYSPLDKEEK